MRPRISTNLALICNSLKATQAFAFVVKSKAELETAIKSLMETEGVIFRTNTPGVGRTNLEPLLDVTFDEGERRFIQISPRKRKVSVRKKSSVKTFTLDEFAGLDLFPKYVRLPSDFVLVVSRPHRCFWHTDNID